MQKLILKKNHWQVLKGNLGSGDKNYSLSMLHAQDGYFCASDGKVIIRVPLKEISAKQDLAGAYMLVSIGRPDKNYIEIIVEPVQDIDAPEFKKYIPDYKEWREIEIEPLKGHNQKEHGQRRLSAIILVAYELWQKKINIYLLARATFSGTWTLTGNKNTAEPALLIDKDSGVEALILPFKT